MLHSLDTDSSKIINMLNQDPSGVRLTQAEILYIDYIVSNMKAIGTWALTNALYGFVGGTAYKHKFNWKDPKDLDTAFRLVYSGTITHSANGITFNGASWARTCLNPFVTLSASSLNMSFYSTVNILPVADEAVMGAENATEYLRLIFRRSDSLTATLHTNTVTALDTASVTRLKSTGYLATNVLSPSTNFMTLDGINYSFVDNNFTVTNVPNLEIYIGSANISNTAGLGTNKTSGFSSIGTGLTSFQAIQQSQIVKNAQAILNRA